MKTGGMVQLLRGWIPGLALAAVAGAATATVATTRATNFATVNSWYTADSDYHLVQRVSLQSGLDDGVTLSVDYDLDPIPNITASSYEDGPCDMNNNDVCLSAQNYGNIGWCGLANCFNGELYTDSTGMRRCDISWNLYNYDCDSTTLNNVTTCHEIGHTVGLRHRNTDLSCMVSSTTQPNMDDEYSPHDKGHIQNYY